MAPRPHIPYANSRGPRSPSPRDRDLRRGLLLEPRRRLAPGPRPDQRHRRDRRLSRLETSRATDKEGLEPGLDLPHVGQYLGLAPNLDRTRELVELGDQNLAGIQSL